MDPLDVGFAPNVAGHTLKHHETVQNSYWNTEQFKCKCGFIVAGNLTQKGKMNARATRAWRDHINATKTPDEILAVGVIQKKRIRWEIFVFPRSYSGAADFAAGYSRGQQWLNPNPTLWWFSCPWAVGISKDRGKTIDTFHTTKADAIARAQKILRSGEEQGHTVYRGHAANLEAPAITPRLSLMEFVNVVDEALDSKKLTMVQETLEKLDQFMEAVPVLAAKRQQLAAHHDTILTMGMDLGIEQEEESGDPQSADGA